MDIERALDKVAKTQIQFAADLGELRSLTVRIADLQAQTTAVLLRLTERQEGYEERQARYEEENQEAHRRYEEAHRRAEEARQRADEARQRADEASQRNEETHARFEETHARFEETFSILMRMMDEWIRDRRKGNGTQ